MEKISELELLCKQLYESTDSSVRATAEKTLIQFSESTECLAQCQLLLERADSPYSQLIAASTLIKLVSKKEVVISIQNRLDIKNYVLNYLVTRQNLQGFVTQVLIQLFSRLTKLGWFDSTENTEKDLEWPFRNVMEPVTKFIQSGRTELVLIGVQLLSSLVAEMNQLSESDMTRSVMTHRKISSSFRDMHLFSIFRLGCNLLREAESNIKSLDFSDGSQHGLVLHSLKLVHNCLAYDFIGTAPDDSGDDMCTVQIPTSWRVAFLDGDILQLFFNLYGGLPQSLSSLALSCLVLMASIRRSLFNNTERTKFLSGLVTGVRSILSQPRGLGEAGNYHEFCRLVARLKSNYQLGELVRVEGYPDFIKLVAEFTVKSLQMWQFGSNSVHYLLSMWQRMVASIPYVKATEPHNLELHTPSVTRAYIQSRLDAVPAYLTDPNSDDPLDDLTTLAQQLDQLAMIGRCEYEMTCQLLVEVFDQSAAAYEKALAHVSPGVAIGDQVTQLMALEQNRLAWLVYIIGAVIGGRVSFASTEDHDNLDGELVCRVLQLMQLSDGHLPNTCEQTRSVRLELAILSFFEQFRRIYVGDNVQKTSKVYRRLSMVLGLSDESMVLSVFIGKIMTNLKYWGATDAIVSRTLTLLNELSVGYSSVRKMVKLSAVQLMLTNHTPEHFPFLSSSIGNGGGDVRPALSHMKLRTTFYTALGRLLMVDLGEDEDRFIEFMEPITRSFNNLAAMLEGKCGYSASPEAAKLLLVGLSRDLRGITYSLNTKASYLMMWEWFFPAYSELVVKALSVWSEDPGLTTPVLKLYAELAQNRSNRLQFDVSSSNGILLFRDISRVLVTYGSRLLATETRSVPKNEMYASRLKGISICFSMLKAALCGNYVNFGVFALYGDDALDKALEMFIKLLLSIPQSDLLEYPKLSQTYYTLLECLAQDHMIFLGCLDPQVFLYILATITEGLTALDTMVCAGCCATIDNILTYIFKLVQRKHRIQSQSAGQVNGEQNGALRRLASESAGSTNNGLALVSARQAQTETNLVRVVELEPGLLQACLSTLLNTVMYEECRSQWAMSRPLLPLILLNEKYFTELRQSMINSQTGDRSVLLAQCFDKLMDGIECSLLTKNRDKFTQNLSVFRRDINESIKGNNNAVSPGVSTSSAQPEMMT